MTACDYFSQAVSTPGRCPDCFLNTTPTKDFTILLVKRSPYMTTRTNASPAGVV